MSERGPAPALDEHEIELLAGSPDGRTTPSFLNFYSKDGLLLGMKAYGVHDKLVQLGLGDYELAVTREDAFRHRLEIFVAKGGAEEQRIMDLRVHLRQIAWPRQDGDARGHGSYPVLVVEWLAMQNPRGHFTRARPRLPGQTHPGAGLGRAMHNILVIMAERTAREAILNVPEHFHLAALYLRAGYRSATLERELELKAVLEATERLPFAAAAWAVERGFVLEDDGVAPRPWRYQPEELVLPISGHFRRQLPGLVERLAERVLGAAPRRFTVDVEGLEASLRAQPVAGLEGYRAPRGRSP